MTTKKDKRIAKNLATFYQQNDFSDICAQGRKEMNDHRTSLGLELGPEHQPEPENLVEPPDVPSCDSCSKPYSANLICGKCQLAFYCSRDCQRHAWKKQGHKQDCDGMKERCQEMAQSVVDQMSNTGAPPIVRVQGLDRLDREGPYRSAQELGLHDVMYDMMKEDTLKAQDRFLSNDPYQIVSFCVWITTTLFRGGRNARQELGLNTTRESDVKRVKDFLYSKDDVFEVWWGTSMAFVLDVVMNKKVFKNKLLHTEAHQMGRNIVAAWSQILTSPKAAKAILFGKHRSNKNHEKARARATLVAESTKKTLLGLEKKKDLRNLLEANINQNLAMMAHWCREFGVDVNMEELVGLKGLNLQMYHQVAVPIAEGTIKKGTGLSNQESQDAIRGVKRG